MSYAHTDDGFIEYYRKRNNMIVRGLKLLRNGKSKHKDPPTENSKTQRRKKALQNYTINQRKFGQQAK